MNEAAWHPDPTGRFAQRYHDGQAWTDHVVDATGAQTSDPLSPSATPSTVSATPASGASTFTVTPPLVVAGVGLLAVLISMFALDWLEVSGPYAETADRSEVAEMIDGLDQVNRAGLGFGSELVPTANLPTSGYFSFGWVLALGVAALAVASVAALPQLRRPAAVAAGVVAVWHLVATLGANNLVEEVGRLDAMGGTGMGLSTSIAIGAWIGLLGLGMAAVGAGVAKPAT